MEVRMSGRDMSLENQDDDDDSYAPIAYLSDEGRQEPTCWNAPRATTCRAPV